MLWKEKIRVLQSIQQEEALNSKKRWIPGGSELELDWRREKERTFDACDNA